MATIHKQEVYLSTSTTVDGKPVFFAFQNDRAYVWFLVEDTIIPYEVMIVGTGHVFPSRSDQPDGWDYVRSIIDGSFVWHLLSRPLP